MQESEVSGMTVALTSCPTLLGEPISGLFDVICRVDGEDTEAREEAVWLVTPSEMADGWHDHLFPISEPVFREQVNPRAHAAWLVELRELERTFEKEIAHDGQ